MGHKCLVSLIAMGACLLVLQRYEGSREPMQQADNAFQERDFWKETRHGRQHDS